MVVFRMDRQYRRCTSTSLYAAYDKRRLAIGTDRRYIVDLIYVTTTTRLEGCTVEEAKVILSNEAGQ